MTIPKYARMEIERRWLVDAVRLPDLSSTPFRMIDDLYVDGGRLRLRALTHSVTGARELKLAKKYERTDPLAGPMTNLYLSEPEYAALAVLPGARIRKRHYVLGPFSVNVFEGELGGLILAEAETKTREEVLAVNVPIWAAREVTYDPFFTGGNQCRVTSSELRERLKSA